MNPMLPSLFQSSDRVVVSVLLRGPSFFHKEILLKLQLSCEVQCSSKLTSVACSRWSLVTDKVKWPDAKVSNQLVSLRTPLRQKVVRGVSLAAEPVVTTEATTGDAVKFGPGNGDSRRQTKDSQPKVSPI